MQNTSNERIAIVGFILLPIILLAMVLLVTSCQGIDSEAKLVVIDDSNTIWVKSQNVIRVGEKVQLYNEDGSVYHIEEKEQDDE